MIVHRVGDHAVLVELEHGEAAHALHAEAMRRRASGALVATDVVPGARTVLLDGVEVATLASELAGWDIPPAESGSGRGVRIPVHFDGPDLADVARHWDVSIDEVPRIVLEADLRVAFCGFAPGFAYLTGLGREVPRRATPRTAVPAGSVALAGEYAGVYPATSPGGWQIVGTAVGVRVWDETREPAALLEPGARVRFVEAR